MFKPFIGDCKNPECGRTGVIIPVRRGICNKCNYEKKQRAKQLRGEGNSADTKKYRGRQQEDSGFNVDSTTSSNSFSGNIQWFEGRRNEIIRRTGSGYRFKNNKSIGSNNGTPSSVNSSGNCSEQEFNAEDSEPVIKEKEYNNNEHERSFGVRSSFSKKKTKSIQYRKKRTGETEVFAEIAEEREWVCFVSSIPLKELTATQFMHVLPKALNKYPLFKLYKPNIQLAADEIHYAWDFKPRSELRKDPRFDKLFELEEQLKQEYKLLKSSL